MAKPGSLNLERCANSMQFVTGRHMLPYRHGTSAWQAKAGGGGSGGGAPELANFAVVPWLAAAARVALGSRRR
jgi:hypothetical protein